MNQLVFENYDDGDYGYPMRDGQKAGQAMAVAFAARVKRLYGWELAPELVLQLSDLVQGTYAPILAFSDPGDGDDQAGQHSGLGEVVVERDRVGPDRSSLHRAGDLDVAAVAGVCD